MAFRKSHHREGMGLRAGIVVGKVSKGYRVVSDITTGGLLFQVKGGKATLAILLKSTSELDHDR